MFRPDADPEVIRKILTSFTILCIVVLIGGIYAITNGNGVAGWAGIAVGGVGAATLEGLGWRFGRRDS
ncbi:MAG TPA: hypothetical protein VGV90_16890 [Solirubrobacteraceae bacterium]|nr:hypothetical protein [Solirubrobacteraceae bacterium]